MKINDFAKKHGVSRQAIYQRLKACKVPLDTVRNEKTQELYPEGENLLVKLYDPEKLTVNDCQSLQGLQLDSLVKERDQAVQDLETAKARIKDLESQLSEARAQAKTAEDHAQALQQASEILTAKLEIVPELRKQIESLESDKQFLQSQIPPRITDGKEHHGFLWNLFHRESK